MQLEYGLDYDAGPPIVTDGTPKAYTADPDTYSDATHSLCTGSPTTCPANWGNVMAVKVHLLGRNTEASPVGYTNDKTFVLGLQADGTSNTFGPFSDNFKRHVYETTVRVHNPADRRTKG
jgi:type IV pilus assembly protein PilW